MLCRIKMGGESDGLLKTVSPKINIKEELHMFKRIICVWLVLLTAAVLFCACGEPGAEVSETTSAPAENSDPAESKAESETSEPATTDATTTSKKESTKVDVSSKAVTSAKTSSAVTSEPYKPHPNDPKDLDPKIGQKIREDYLVYRKEQYQDTSIKFENIWIFAYYGTYSFGDVIFMGGEPHFTGGRGEIIAGYEFSFSSYAPLLLHQSSMFYPVEVAYETGKITKEEVGIIHRAYNGG